MSCSRIFSGDLPELMNDIIKYLQNDFSTLHSCILVNRSWCRLTIPLLWENPFSIPTKNYNFIEIYLNNLNNKSKLKLNKYKINNNLLPSNTLFNYPSFIKYLNTGSISFSIEKWFKTLKPESRYFLQESNTFLEVKFKGLIWMLLLKLFIENEENLYNFDIEITDDSNIYFEDFLELMLQNPNFINNIRNFKLYIEINSLFINCRNMSIKNRISQMIDSHQNLKKIVLGYKSFPFYQSLLLSNNCSNSLNTIIFYNINFCDIINLDKVFDQLNVLKSVHIVYCSSLDNDFIQQIINLTKPFKLKSLFIREILKIKSLELLLQKSGGYLENIGYNFECDNGLFKQKFLELIIKYCKNIKFFELQETDNQIIYLALDLIENIRQNINYLSIDIYGSSDNCDSFILRNLGQKLPLKLEYLCLNLNINTNDFEIFLKNSQNTFINKLLINNLKAENILSCIKENIMKKKRVKYLAIMNSFDYIDLFSLKDVVKEFEFYNIIIQKYDDLIIYADSVNFVKELD
ncbi:uncharacterized protein OCT59_006907 [Rhizophagus irregularis]|uniref:F-box domain-containing protein n=2 Tax=Rhizophagus irregularis TaxID=588596 RepID=A0A015K4Z3_RHIIW|nr:hypothetical protein GLOIN_2v1766454 [Rhizophagus irregularis DAOM 181602=DAOM 197198]EXX74640.1 hypothetical protein RirG_049230 [Rhizophagus irregularis DAOM 197198w]POG78565.1 hypothetical protein GLOIN_2v1766454 [Rhizophagus irregularis DAOM 181602=DAOM 197198]UZO15487.1 hypothetical protein OCT59_006907 [Rhizophagus irregularis]GBC32526.1 hypothetical protein GLOIN_2v1766454 [Rhizophagus irregularis DAOM 181602=DAOM 197198]|eukprot:XP_025185431.1 hypothetical protein GLOIN_2v1766454 [Rhizophagus irregularis DAOM 181602=DAOM 197198]